ncbi:MAG: hypothetical protein G01um10143_131 [Parcubacteria group bacterium Gr01-1014_3]|nr:MAG: hypothetical protein G01um10143_131 [Parcubacteria group bacterium Gr01-1014_3]
MKITTLVTEPKDYSEKALAIYRSLGEVYEGKNLRPEVTILVVRLAYKIDKAWMEKLPNLKYIVSPTTGLNHIDLDEAKKRKIKIISLKGHTSFLKNIPSTAEETFGLILALVRNFPWAFDDVKKGNWNREIFRGHQLIHKTLGLVGCGRLGKIVAKYAKAFGMRVIGADPFVDAKTMKRFDIEKVELPELLKESDIVSVHVALEKETHNLIGEKEFKLMKPGAYLVNTARGEIVDEKFLLNALQEEKLAGAALDVLWNEVGGRHLRNNPLIEYAKKDRSRLLIVPHLGGATYEAMQVTEDFVADLLKKEIQ